MKKTNAARILDKHKIDYKIIEYKVDENDLSALHVAQDTNTDIKLSLKLL
jgi:Cys-tRNA(Pro)/Cys-tRNA(Cys) deacylase